MNTCVHNLSWSHFRALLRVPDEDARLWYLNEAAGENWSVRTLDRNISTQYYYRLLQAPKKDAVVAEMKQKTAEYQTNRFELLKNPIIAEFLGFKAEDSYLESAILSHIRDFLLEMVKFRALQSAIVSESNSPKGHDEPIDEPIDEPLDESLEEKILVLMRETPNCTYDALADFIGVSRSTIRRTIKLLADQGKIERVGGKLCHTRRRDSSILCAGREKEGARLIYLYTKKQGNIGWILKNDLYFNLYTGNQPLTEADKEAIQEIDRAVVTANNHIQTKYGLGTIRNLSTGCKTYLNIIKNPDKVVSAQECGGNVLEKIFALDGIHIYMDRPERFQIGSLVQICFNDVDIVTGRSGYEDWWSKEYERRESADL